jgi:hypothetical protein
MPITHHQEDILPNIALGQGKDSANITVHSGKAFAQDFSGCINLIGHLQLCYELDLNPGSAKISLKVLDVTVFQGEVNAANPCLHFSGSYRVAKWDLKLCLDLKGQKITLDGKACALFSCRSFNITILHW